MRMFPATSSGRMSLGTGQFSMSQSMAIGPSDWLVEFGEKFVFCIEKCDCSMDPDDRMNADVFVLAINSTC